MLIQPYLFFEGRCEEAVANANGGGGGHRLQRLRGDAAAALAQAGVQSSLAVGWLMIRPG